MKLCPSTATTPCRLALMAMAVSVVAGCGDSARTVLREDESVRPYMQFSVIVERETGSLGPAQINADAICAEALQSALMYMSTDVGDDQTRYFFRCR